VTYGNTGSGVDGGQGNELLSAVQWIVGAATAGNAIRSKTVDISDWGTFLLGELPYGQIDRNQLRRGVIQRAGLAKGPNAWDEIANGSKYDEIMHWQFGQDMCSVAAALRLPYIYPISYGQPYTDAILIGYVARQPKAYSARSADHQTLQTMVGLAKSLGQPATHIAWNADRPPNANPQDADPFVSLLQTYSPYEGSCTFEPANGRIEVCGLARDYDSMHPFTLTIADLATDRSKYDQLLHWPFAGTPRRITKAMRVHFGPDTQPMALLIGYEGPGHD
jgi:hypothetical protein